MEKGRNKKKKKKLLSVENARKTRFKKFKNATEISF